jgi:integrase
MVVLAALTGLRVGELLALRWRGVNLTAGTIRISESVFHGQVQLPKSERSIRTIPIGPQTRVLLEEHRKRFAANWSEEGLLFPNQLGGPHRESNLLGRVLRPAAKAAGLERVTWHQLRTYMLRSASCTISAYLPRLRNSNWGTLLSRPR